MERKKLLNDMFIKSIEGLKIKRELYISLTNKCNFSCYYCNIPKQKIKKELNFNSLLSYINNTLFIENIRPIFGGGEPLLYSKFDDLVSTIKPSYRIFTNFSFPFNRYEHLVKNTKLDSIIGTLHFKYLKEDKLELILNTIKRLNGIISVSVRLMLDDQDTKFDKIIKFLEESNVKFRLIPLENRGRTIENLKFNRDFRKYMFKFKIRDNNDNLFELTELELTKERIEFCKKSILCDLPSYYSLMNEDGKIYSCEFSNQIGDVSKNKKIPLKIICKSEKCPIYALRLGSKKII